MKSVVYLGQKIDSCGISPVEEKVKAVHQAPDPTNVTELKSYFGQLTYYNRFLPYLAATLAPMYQLLKPNVAWIRNKERGDALEASKRLLTSTKVLTHIDLAEEIVLACDASSYGVGAVLSHTKKDGKEQPIAFVSRTLNSAERNYSQIEREALACIFRVKRFHQYLYGRKFILYTDHKPLQTLFSPSRGVPSQVSARIQRWALTMAAYENDIKYKKTSQHGNAYGLNHLPLTESDEEKSEVPTEVVLLVEALEDAPMTYTQIQRWTKRDPLLSKVSQFILYG